MDELEEQYESIRNSGGYAVCNRTQIEITGDDCATFLHSFCTNDINQLEPGQGCEAFLTNVQGKTVGFVFVFRGEKSIFLETAAGQGDSIFGHLDRYLIREDAEIHDRTDRQATFTLGGTGIPDALNSMDCSIPDAMFAHAEFAYGSIRRTPTLGESSFSIVVENDAAEEFAAKLSGLTRCSTETIDIFRVERGIPEYGVDLTEKNLPQEIDRDSTAINFTKGCYLGQETVARIDALGHVNRKLVGLRLADSIAVGTEICSAEKTVGQLTSSVVSPRFGAIGMGYVRSEHASVGTKLRADDADVEVVALPHA